MDCEICGLDPCQCGLQYMYEDAPVDAASDYNDTHYLSVVVQNYDACKQELARAKEQLRLLAEALKRWGINDRFIAEARVAFDLADSILNDEHAPTEE